MSLATLKTPFRSLSVPNYRRYFVGQIISLSGNWMQIVAEMWLVLRLTNSSVALGVTAALQFVPMLFAGAWGGLLADRVSKRGLLMITQALMAIPALTLWILTARGVPLAAMALVGTLSFNFQVILPLMAHFAFHGSATTYAALTTAMAVGAICGALAAGTRETIKPQLIAGAAFAFGIFSLAAAA